MARTKSTVDVKAELTKLHNTPLKNFTAQAKEMANAPTHNGLQMQIALMFYVGAKKSGKAAFDGNATIFVPFCESYYGPGKGLQRAALKGFQPSGKHDADSSAATLLRGYNCFAAAAKAEGDVEPAIRSLLEAGGDFATKGIAAKGAALTKLIVDGKAPTPKAVAAAIDAVNNKPEAAKVSPVKAIARALRSSVNKHATNTAFSGALTEAEAKAFNELVIAAVQFKNLVVGQSQNNADDTKLLGLVASLGKPVEAPKPRRARK